MSNEENIKQVWQTPEIFDLDVDKTSGKFFYPIESSTSSLGAS